MAAPAGQRQLCARPAVKRVRWRTLSALLAVAAPDLDAMKGEESITWKGKEVKCKTLYGSYKKEGDTVEFKAWINDRVPGGVVKRTRTTKQKDDTITTTVTLQSYQAGQ